MTSFDSGRPESVRLHLLTGVNLALARHTEVITAISKSADRAEAAKAVQELLELDRNQTEAVLTLQWQRLTKGEVDALRGERARLAAELGTGGPTVA